MSVKQLPMICLMGPTAVGKSQIAIDLTRQFQMEIISVDSVMVYRGMNIGTAKPDESVLANLTHHLVDIRDPTSPYSVGEFFQAVQTIVKASFAKGRIPLLVGGTMLYFNALKQGLADLPSYRDYPNYFEVKAEVEALALDTLYRNLKECDPVTAHSLHLHDRQRIERALLVYYLSNNTLSDLQQSSQRVMPYPMHWIIVYPPDRVALRERIAGRFKAMLGKGLLEEAQELRTTFALSEKLPAYRAVGYRQAFDYLSGQSDYETFITRSITATSKLAKRQLTWLRNWKDTIHFNADDPNLLENISQHIQQLIS